MGVTNINKYQLIEHLFIKNSYYQLIVSTPQSFGRVSGRKSKVRCLV